MATMVMAMNAMAEETTTLMARENGSVTLLDRITIVSRTGESAVNSMASVSQISGEELERRMATNANDIFFGVPGIKVYSDGRPAVSNFNIRGLQDAGRVSVIVDGARQNFHKAGHEVSRMFWLDPQLVQQVDVIRGPSANTFGSGAIGGVVYFETKKPGDFLKEDENFAVSLTGRYESNGSGWTTSAIGAYRFNDAASVLANIVWRDYGEYKDGDGSRVENSGFDVLSGHVKATLKPTEHSELTLGWTGSEDQWSSTNTRDYQLDSNTFTGEFKISDAEEKWLNLNIKAAVNQIDLTQTDRGRRAGTSSYDLRTSSFDIWNTSYFDTGLISHELTVGGDWVHDDFASTAPFGGADTYNPTGTRSVWGAYVQDKLTYDWLEVVAGLRYDSYELEASSKSSGDRFSPRLSVGVSPFREGALSGLQVYGSYSEGYRAPNTSEAFITGGHAYPGFSFAFLPNPDLRPETGKTWEAGINYTADGLFNSEDTLRLKAAYFHNDIDDYITIPTMRAMPGSECASLGHSMCAQYQNVYNAKIQGFELEGRYDAGRYFAGLGISIIDGHQVDRNGVQSDLKTIPSASVTLDGGMRFLERRLTLGGEVQYNKAPSGTTFAEDYTLVNLYANYQASENLRFDFRVDNLFDKKYVLPIVDVSDGMHAQPGLTVKLGATMRFGG
ncbi:TonB-dependent receptor [Nitratireductor sp. GISD-1A_MAKvit]|uniref:TonB-dependent receptor domain-containing protein n=1 Tax=Nitratireductor sp. GISD-1A_MAKvit TaxID=3234198 RepID=UPI003465E84A